LHYFLRNFEFVLSSFSVRFLKLSLILKKLSEFVPTILTSLSNSSLAQGVNQPFFRKSVPFAFATRELMKTVWRRDAFCRGGCARSGVRHPGILRILRPDCTVFCAILSSF